MGNYCKEGNIRISPGESTACTLQDQKLMVKGAPTRQMGHHCLAQEGKGYGVCIDGAFGGRFD